MKLYKFLIIAIFALAVSFSGCKKVESRINGTWKSELMLADPPVTITWAFNDDGTLTRTCEGDEVFTDVCFYTVEKKLGKTYILFDESGNLPGYSEVDGRWRVELFNDEIMKIRRIEKPATAASEASEEGLTSDGAYLYREFKRVN